MLKILKLLKSSWAIMLVVIALLGLQAYCDLSLPTYTSDIVDVGIQGGGIKSAVPEAIEENYMKAVLYFLDDKGQKEVLDSYTLVTKDSVSAEEYKDYLDKYPALEKENIYVLKDLDKEKTDNLDQIIDDPMLIVGSLGMEGDATAKLKEQVAKLVPAELQKAPLLAMIISLPKEEANKFLEPITKKIEDTPDSLKSQGAAAIVKYEYQALGMDTDKIQTHYILFTGLKMLGLALIAMISTVLVGFFASRMAAKLGKELRGKVFRKVVSFSNSEFDHFSTASLITRNTNDIQQIQTMLVFLIRIVFYSPILAIGGIVKVLNTNVSMTWIIALAVILIITIVGTLFIVAMPKFKSLQKLLDRLNLVTREILTGLSVIRAFHKEQSEEVRFDEANRDLTKTNLFVNRAMTFMMPLMMLVMNGVSVLIIWSGAHGVNNGEMQVGDLMAFLQYTMQIIMSFLMFSMISIMLPRASVAAGRVLEVLDSKVTIHDPVCPQALLPDKKGYVEFKSVDFKYPNADDKVLEDISFTAEPGKTTAIIGSTGSGKSTMVHLIPRFYDVTGGNIFVDGVDIRELNQHDLRDKIGFVPQKGVLFTGTIESNIKYGKTDASEEEMKKAARIAQAVDFIEEKTEKYQTPISQGGSNVSGGQKQRLSIARAIAKDPEIFIFDDSFSALDYKTDVLLRKALNEEIENKTIIIVAQRISTILHADQIIVLDDGKIVGKGTHKELLKNCDVYNQIALSQLSKEELAYE
ncbi:ABC transporter ATP-binding protein [Anaerocolumna xylanovorans]|uniref:ATP-binding cassette, subfamily B n=1 Tax=Anaerocolumna xylanovorans DSM 12503 TaxID=1121345 RepID=A0A1M7YFQ9_9FIRM|nr:ABC transporter ATP-binding protein [Anaerocolumna xylanovorans]SHO51474.1 ATP-binding cassette, subfamily B [Anaerocolumna xylanovorans DSM 12503]